MIYDWIRDHGQVLGAAIATVAASAMALLGWHVRREQQWRDRVDAKLETIIPRAEVVRMIETHSEDHDQLIEALVKRMDRTDAHVDQRFREQREAIAEHLRLVRGNIGTVSKQLDRLIDRTIRPGPRDRDD